MYPNGTMHTWIVCSLARCVYMYSGAPLIWTPLGPSTCGRIMEVSTFQGLLLLVAERISNDVMRPVTCDPKVKAISNDGAISSVCFTE